MSERRVRSNKKRKKVITWIVAIVAVLGIIGGGIAYYVVDVLGELRREELTPANLDIYDDPTNIMWQYHNDVKNFVLLGIDARNLSHQSRSDVMIIVSINYSNNTIRLVSLQRDLYVRVRGSNTKLSHAYFYGGAELAVSTINNNFQMNVDDHVTVNFYSVADIINELGGVSLEITEAERRQININLDEQYELGMDGTYVTQSGMVTLNGSQAVAFARIRAIDSDFARGERQRKVIMAAFEKVKTSSLTNLDSLIRVVLDACSTSFTNAEILDMSSWLLSNLNSITFESESLPGTLCSYGFSTIDGLSYVTCNMSTAINSLKDFLYDQSSEDVPVPIARPDEESEGGQNAEGESGTGENG